MEYKLNKLKYIPSYSDLEKMKRLDILGGIHRNGGFKKVSEKLKIPSKSEFLKIYPKEYQGKWSEEKIEKEIEVIIKKIGKFPQEKDLNSLGRRDLYNGIKRICGGMKKFREKMGY